MSVLDLPDEILLDIMFRLSAFDIVRFGGSCKRINTVSKDNSIWSLFCLSDYTTKPGDFYGFFMRNSIETYKTLCRNTSTIWSGSLLPTNPILLSWKIERMEDSDDTVMMLVDFLYVTCHMESIRALKTIYDDFREKFQKAATMYPIFAIYLEICETIYTVRSRCDTYKEELLLRVEQRGLMEPVDDD